MSFTRTVLCLILISGFIVLSTSCSSSDSKKEAEKITASASPPKAIKSSEEAQELIIDEFLKQGAWQYPMFSKEWGLYIDQGIKKDPTVAYLYQQRAMPLFKQRKYELGMKYLDNAVKYAPEDWLDYRAFIKCIFAKTYSESLIDFKQCKHQLADGFVMDHSYDFYMSLCYLQLNQYKKAERTLASFFEKELSQRGEGSLHYTDLFYMGIIKYELLKYEEAIVYFDKSLADYSEFSDAKYYKAKALREVGKIEESKLAMKAAKKDAHNGNTIGEINSIYEPYPYQVNWEVEKL